MAQPPRLGKAGNIALFAIQFAYFKKQAGIFARQTFDLGRSDGAAAEHLFNIVQGIMNRICQSLAFRAGHNVFIIAP